MPLLQYFGWVGSLLLAVILVANAYLPAPAAPKPEIPLDRKISIRIHTDHKWPERVVFDTTTTMVAQHADTETGIDRGEAAVEAQRQPLDAFAATAATHARPCFRPPCPTVSPRSAGARDFGKPVDLRFARSHG